jgi:hypothetical protein
VHKKILCPLSLFLPDLGYKDFLKSGDNYVGTVYKGHFFKLSFIGEMS